MFFITLYPMYTRNVLKCFSYLGVLLFQAYSVFLPIFSRNT